MANEKDDELKLASSHLFYKKSIKINKSTFNINNYNNNKKRPRTYTQIYNFVSFNST